MKKIETPKKKKVIILFVTILIMMALTACKGDKLGNKDAVSYNYEKRIEEIEIKNETKNTIYVDFDVFLLDKDGEVRYKEEYRGKTLTRGEVFSIDLEDIKPEYVKYDKVDSIDMEVLEIYECNVWKVYLLIFMCAALLALYLPG